MTNEERLELEKNLIKNLSESNINYIPIKKEDYEKFYFDLKFIDALINGVLLIALLSALAAFITIIAKLVIFAFAFDFDFSIYFPFYCLGLAIISALAVRLLFIIKNKIIKRHNLIESGDINDFTEITLLKYNNIKDLSAKNSVVKSKVQEIMKFREGKIFDFDYNQLNINLLISSYKALDNAKKINDSISKVKESFIEQQVDQEWLEQAYPLQQITIILQGTKLSNKADMLSLLETISARLKSDDTNGCYHKDEFGYSFQYQNDIQKSIFKNDLTE